MEDIYRLLEKIREKYPDSESMELTATWEKAARRASLTSNLKENDAFKIIVSQYTMEIKKIDKELANTPELFNDEDGKHLGRMLCARKKFCQDFLRIFDIADKRLDSLRKTIESGLKDDE